MVELEAPVLWNVTIRYECGCGGRRYRVTEELIPRLGTVVECDTHGLTEIARTSGWGETTAP